MYFFKLIWWNITYIHDIKILSLKKQNLAVEAAAGGSYDANILLTVEPKTLAGVNPIFYIFILPFWQNIIPILRLYQKYL